MTSQPNADQDVVSPLRYLALCFAAITIFTSYYESDIIGPVADLLERQRGFSQSDIGDLTAIISLPNVILALANGLLIDRFGAARVVLAMALISVIGAVMTAIGQPYGLMWTGRLIYGIGEGAIFIALIAGIAGWFPKAGVALATALFLSLARIGSFSLDTSPTWAHSLYDLGWQPPLWLGAAMTILGLVTASAFWFLDRWRPNRLSIQSAPIQWRQLAQFDLSFWYMCGLHVLYASVFFPFRQTFAIEYFQHVKHLSLQEAGNVNSGVFAAAVFATPLFGLIADIFGHRSLFLTIGTLLLPITFIVLGLTDWSPWISTVLMGVSFALVPAIIWPSTTLIVSPVRLGTALGIITVLQAFGLWASNKTAGWLADRAGASLLHPEGYNTLLWFFGLLSLTALACVSLLLIRERGPHGHGLERSRREGGPSGAISTH
jgi:MFS family permease